MSEDVFRHIMNKGDHLAFAQRHVGMYGSENGAVAAVKV
jgi:hypothetical protein